ncbi:MAG: hypothetical protein AAF995_08415, partial [Planctomycetota bacterium]
MPVCARESARLFDAFPRERACRKPDRRTTLGRPALRRLALGLALAAGGATASAQQLVVTEDLEIPAGWVEQWPDGVFVQSGTLTIGAGVVFELGNDAAFRVRGTSGGQIELLSTAAAPVTFRPLGTSWNGIELDGVDAKLRHVVVEGFLSTGVDVRNDAEVLISDAVIGPNSSPAGASTVVGIDARANSTAGPFPSVRVVRTTVGPLTGRSGASGSDGNQSARDADPGRSVIGINGVNLTELVVVSSFVGPLAGGDGGNGFDGGNGGTGGTGSGGTVISPTGSTGGPGGNGENGGEGGDGGDVTGIRFGGSTTGDARLYIANTVITELTNGKGGNAGDGGSGGRGGRGGNGVSFTPVGGNGGRGGRGGNGGSGGIGGDAGIANAIDVQADNAIATIAHNTIYDIRAEAFRGTSGEGGSPGTGGAGGSGGDGIFSDGSGG